MEFVDYVEGQRPALMRFATVLTGQTWLAEDLVSDVLGRVYEHWDRIERVENVHAYVRRMVVNDFLSWRRRLARSQPSADLEPAPVSDGTDARAERDAMLQRLDQLPRKQRAAVVLRYYAGLPDVDIAAHLGCRESTVRSQISRALGTLRIDATSTLSMPLETR